MPSQNDHEDQDNLISKIDIFPNLSPNQRDKVNMQEVVKHSLMGFLQNKIRRVEAGSRIKQLVEEEIIKRIEDPESGLSATHLIRLYEAVLTSSTEEEGHILELLKDDSKIQINNTTEVVRNEKEYSVQDMEKAKEALSNFNKLLDSPAVKQLIEAAEIDKQPQSPQDTNNN